MARSQSVLFQVAASTFLCQRYNGATYDNYSAEAVTPYGTQQPLMEDTADYLYIGDSAAVWTMVGFYYHTAGSYGARTWEYWNGSAWTSFTPTYDGTAGFSTHGYIVLGSLSAWASTTVNTVAAYWVRVKVASVATAAQMYNLLLNLTLDVPHKLQPNGAVERRVRDINGVLRAKDVAITTPLMLTAKCVQRTLNALYLTTLLTYLKDNSVNVVIYDEARTTPIDPTVDSPYYLYNGYVHEFTPMAAFKMDVEYDITFELNSVSPILA